MTGRSSNARQLRLFRKRLEGLAREVGHDSFLSTPGINIVTYQGLIAELQWDIQSAITTAKQEVKGHPELHEHLEFLRNLRWQSRRLGDAVAWSVLLLNRKLIRALSKNQRVVIARQSTSSVAVMVAADECMRAGWGIPIIHDITDSLRIGDVTFLSFGDEITDQRTRTFELKSSVTGRHTNEDGTEGETVNVIFSSIEALPDDIDLRPRPTASGGELRRHPDGPRRRPDRRFAKQMERMRVATEHKLAVDNSVTLIAEENVINLVTEDHVPSRWSELRRSIRTARRNGYSFMPVDRFSSYILFYDAAGVEPDKMQLDEVNADILNAFFGGSVGDRDNLTVLPVPIGDDSDFTERVIPFFLFDIPRRAINDLINNRLVIMCLMNSKGVETALTDEGFEVTPSMAKDSRLFDVSFTLEWESGEKLGMRVPAPWAEMVEAAQEFRGVESVMSKVRAMRDLPRKIPYADFVPDRD